MYLGIEVTAIELYIHEIGPLSLNIDVFKVP
jgi:hypothetical protein